MGRALRLAIFVMVGLTACSSNRSGDNDDNPPDSTYLHVETDGPAWVVDYDEDSHESVTLDGSPSHTHEKGHELTRFTWSLGETTIGEGELVTVELPVGSHEVTQTIADDHKPPRTLSGTHHIDVYPIEAVGGGLAKFYQGTSDTLQSLLDSVPDQADHMEILPKLSLTSVSGKVGSSSLVDNVIVVVTGEFSAPEAGNYVFSLGESKDKRVFVDGTQHTGPATLGAGKHTLELRFALATTDILPADISVSIDDGAPTPLIDLGVTHSHRNLPPFVNYIPKVGPVAGNHVITVEGVGFFGEDDVVVHWGDTTIKPTHFNATRTSFQVITPPGSDTIDVSVETPRGRSAVTRYEYSGSFTPIGFDASVIAELASPTRIAYGPDGRIYVASVTGHIAAYTVDDDYQVTATQHIDTITGLSNPNILGMAFNPHEASGPTRIYVGHALLFANDGSCFTGTSPYSGQISVLEGPNFDRAIPVVTSLPVSNHDHGINGIEFDNHGDLYVAIGGNTNAGVRHCKIGDIPESPLSAAVVKATITKDGFNGAVQYVETNSGRINNDQVFGNTVNLAPNVDVSVYSSGLRNSFDLVLSTAGIFYATDNGPNKTFGRASTSATTMGPHPSEPDELLVLAEGAYFGHPNRNRGRTDPRQNVYHAPDDPEIIGKHTRPIATLASSTNAIEEYRATNFESKMRGNLLAQRWKSNLYRVSLKNSRQSRRPSGHNRRCAQGAWHDHGSRRRHSRRRLYARSGRRDEAPRRHHRWVCRFRHTPVARTRHRRGSVCNRWQRLRRAGRYQCHIWRRSSNHHFGEPDTNPRDHSRRAHA